MHGLLLFTCGLLSLLIGMIMSRDANQFIQWVNRCLYRVLDDRQDISEMRQLLYKAYQEGVKAGKNERDC